MRLHRGVLGAFVRVGENNVMSADLERHFIHVL
jgi:hypothetical protein